MNLKELTAKAGNVDLEDYKIISENCIGLVGKVKTVVLVPEVPFEDVETILIDYQSRSSVLLAKVLAKFYWKKNFKGMLANKLYILTCSFALFLRCKTFK